MDKQQYHDKALSLLNDKSTYAVLNSDPTSKTQRKLNKMLLDLKKAGKISDSTYKMLYSSDGLCPRFYGLPKIHKLGIPLRPKVSFVNSPTYAISGYLARILSPVVGNTDYTVMSSRGDQSRFPFIHRTILTATIVYHGGCRSTLSRLILKL